MKREIYISVTGYDCSPEKERDCYALRGIVMSIIGIDDVFMTIAGVRIDNISYRMATAIQLRCRDLGIDVTID